MPRAACRVPRPSCRVPRAACLVPRASERASGTLARARDPREVPSIAFRPIEAQAGPLSDPRADASAPRLRQAGSWTARHDSRHRPARRPRCERRRTAQRAVPHIAARGGGQARGPSSNSIQGGFRPRPPRSPGLSSPWPAARRSPSPAADRTVAQIRPPWAGVRSRGPTCRAREPGWRCDFRTSSRFAAYSLASSSSELTSRTPVTGCPLSDKAVRVLPPRAAYLLPSTAVACGPAGLPIPAERHGQTMPPNCPRAWSTRTRRAPRPRRGRGNRQVDGVVGSAGAGLLRSAAGSPTRGTRSHPGRVSNARAQVPS